jgi:hypothetical protein
MPYFYIFLSIVNILMPGQNFALPLNEVLAPFFLLTTSGKIVYHVSSGG